MSSYPLRSETTPKTPAFGYSAMVACFAPAVNCRSDRSALTPGRSGGSDAFVNDAIGIGGKEEYSGAAQRRGFLGDGCAPGNEALMQRVCVFHDELDIPQPVARHGEAGVSGEVLVA